MRKIYIDNNFVCHSDQAEGRTAVETDALDHVCDAALSCYIYVPKGENYTKENGATVNGEFIQCIDSRSADLLQSQYESLLLQMDAAYREGVASA